MSFKFHPPGAKPKFHYLTIDATDPVDSLAFGQTMRLAFYPAWDNLLNSLIGSGGRRLDAGQPLLLRKAKSRNIVDPKTQTTTGKEQVSDEVVLPQGQDSSSNPNSDGLTDAQIVAANLFCRSLVLAPGVSGGALSNAGGDPIADIVFISSHGYASGEMKGLSHAGATFFDIAAAAAGGLVFAGPRWLFLANCTTLDPGLNNDWMKLMGAGSTLRGVVGFQGRFPDPDFSAGIFKQLFSQLKLGKTFIAAWKETIESRGNPKAAPTMRGLADQWVVLCHDEAANDTMQLFVRDQLPTLKSGGPLSRFDFDHPTGMRLVAQPPAFDAAWQKAQRIDPDNRAQPANRLNTGNAVTIAVFSPFSFMKFSPGDIVQITLIYIRPTYPQVLNVRRMFHVTGVEGSTLQNVSFARLNDAVRTDPAFTAAEQTQHNSSVDSWVVKMSQTTNLLRLHLKCDDLSTLKHTEQPLGFDIRIAMAGGMVNRRELFLRGAILAMK
jgi:hypothetical protein